MAPFTDELGFDTSIPTHIRRIEITTYERKDAFDMVARLRDDRPWAEEEDPHYAHLHDILLSVTVSLPHLEITSATAKMDRFPHAECTLIEDAFKGLVGLSLKRGYSREVQARFGRALGCTHLELLAKALGPAVVQVLPASRRRRQGPDPKGGLFTTKFAATIKDTCHVWREGGAGPEKIRLGWKPGFAPVPVPTVEDFERLGADAINESGKEH